jgi:hypothetical protein
MLSPRRYYRVRGFKEGPQQLPNIISQKTQKFPVEGLMPLHLTSFQSLLITRRLLSPEAGNQSHD